MNEDFMMWIEMVVFKMIEEGKIALQKTVNEKGDVNISINCVLKDDEPGDNGEYAIYSANPEGRNGVKIGEFRNL